MNPTTIAVAVTAIIHEGSGSDIVVPSDDCFVLHRSVHPDSANKFDIGPSPPHTNGVMLAQ